MPLLISVAISSVFIPKRARRNSFTSNLMLVLAGFPGMYYRIIVTFHHTLRVKQAHAPRHRHHEGHAGSFISAMWLYF